MREVTTSALEVGSVAAIIAGVWSVAGWGVAAIVGGALGLVVAYLVTD